MWNRFESCKMQLKQEMQTQALENGQADPEQSRQAKVLMEQYLPCSVSRAKAQLIAWLLESTRFQHSAEDLFVARVVHRNIMWDFQGQMAAANPCREFGKQAQQPEIAHTVNPGMDFGHIAPDWQYLLHRGISGVLTDLEQFRQNHLDEPERVAYYDDRLLVYRALQDFLHRQSQQLDASGKPGFIAKNLQVLSEQPPQTLAQAMQLILIIYAVQTDLDTVTVRSLGGLDRMLYPYFQNDLESGRYTRAQLSELTRYFLWKIYTMNVTANMPFYICGMLEDGTDASNEFTVFLLENYRELDIYDPKIHVMYHENMNSDVLDLILQMIAEGKNSFVFINTPLASTALEGIGISPEDAKKVIVYGCYETASEGEEIPCTCGGTVNLVRSLELALNSGTSFDDFDSFFQDVMARLEHYTTVCMDVIRAYEPHYPEICPSMILSPTFRSSRESGLDVYSGGAKYNNTSIVGAGLATLVDSLIAIRHVVFEEKQKNLSEFRQILQDDWKSDEKLRLIVKKRYPKFGNHMEEADQLAVAVFNRFSRLINGRKNGRGGVFRCGMFSVDWRFWMGAQTGATPDGRYAGEPLSKNLAASIGQDQCGVTAYLNSLLQLDSRQCPDGYVADVALHCSAVKGREGMEAFRILLGTFMKNGGFSVHFNILSPETLIDAQKEPEKYQNLQIRLCGWNVRFVDLDKKQQDEFIQQAGNGM